MQNPDDYSVSSIIRDLGEGTKRFEKSFCLVPKPRLGNALAWEAPRLPVTGDGPKPGLRAQMRSQAGAWERGKAGAWERGKKSFYGFGRGDRVTDRWQTSD